MNWRPWDRKKGQRLNKTTRSWPPDLVIIRDDLNYWPEFKPKEKWTCQKVQKIFPIFLLFCTSCFYLVLWVNGQGKIKKADLALLYLHWLQWKDGPLEISHKVSSHKTVNTVVNSISSNKTQKINQNQACLLFL